MTTDLYVFEAPFLRDEPIPRVELRVDRGRRTIAGLAVPWGVPSQVAGGNRYRFGPGVIELPEKLSRVKFLREHDQRQLLGRATRIEERSAGLWTEFLVSRVPEGDRALVAAEDGSLDGLSVGVDVLDMGRPDADGIQAPRRGRLVEVSLTPFPSFDGARVEHVAASRDRAGTVAASGDEPPLLDPVGIDTDTCDWNPRLPAGCEFDDPHADVFRGVHAPSPVTRRLVTATDGAVLTVTDDRDAAIREAAAVAVVNNVLGGCPIEPPWGFTPAEVGAFNGEVHRLQLAGSQRSADDSLRQLQAATA